MALLEVTPGGHIDTMKRIMRSGADVNDNYGLALCEAVAKGYVETVKHLSLSGADVNRTDTNGQTPLMVAAVHKNEKIVKYLVKAGVDVNKRSHDGQTPLMISAHNGYVDIVQKLLNAGADVNKLDNRGCTALVLAAQEGHVSVADILINSGADVNMVCGTTYRNALYEFVVKNNTKGVRLLLKSGANVNTDMFFVRSLSTPILKDDMRELLFAAGQNISPRKGTQKIYGNCTLQNRCRMVIRSHLLQIDRQQNLFCRIPRLGLPSPLVGYLLYDISLDDDKDDDVGCDEKEVTSVELRPPTGRECGLHSEQL